MEEKARRGVPWTVLSFASNKVVSTLTTLALARLLSPSDFGVLAVTQIILNLLFWFGGLSFASSIVARQDLDRLGLRTAFSLMLASGVAAAVFTAAAAVPLGHVFRDSRVPGVLLALSSVFVITSLATFYDALLQRELEFRRRFVALSVQTVSGAVISLALAVLGAGVWSLIIGQIGAAVLYTLILLRLAPVRMWPGFERRRAASLLRTGRGFLAQGVSVFIRQNADNVTVGRAFGSGALGFYSMAYRLGDLSYWAIADPVARVTFPGFARSTARGEDVRPTFLRVLRLVALVACPVGVLLSAAAEPFTRAVLGTKWLPMAGPLTILGLWAALRPIDTTLFWLLNSLRRAGLVAWLSVAILVPLIPGFIVAVSIGHLTAVAVVVVMDTLISVAALVWFVRRAAAIPVADQWRAVAPIVLACAPAWLVTRYTARAVGFDHPAIALVVGAAAGVAAYGLVITLVDRRLVRESVTSLLGVVRRRSPAVADPVRSGDSGEPAAVPGSPTAAED